MKQTAIIYCRKSTDREWRQQNTHVTQLKKCRDLASSLELIVLDEIVESVSAKESGTRKGFERLLEAWKSWKVDYIIIDEADRLSRDDIDTANFTTMLRSWSIKGLYVNGRLIGSEDDFAINMLWQQLWMAKLDNSLRSKKVKKNMETALLSWKVLSKFPFGYKNITIKKGSKGIEVIEKEADLVRRAFIMRSQKIALKPIAEFLASESGTKWDSQKVSNMLRNVKYYGLQKFWWQEALINTPWYEPIISKELFEKVNGIKAISYSKSVIPKYFDNILYDEDGVKLSGYIQKKKYVYYHTTPQSKHKINISENKLFDIVWEMLWDYSFSEPFIRLTKATLKDIYKDKVQSKTQKLRQNTLKAQENHQKSESLVDKFLEDSIDKDTYERKKKEFEEIKRDLEEQRKAIEQWEDNIIELIEDMCEIVTNLQESYKNWDSAKKWKIIRALQCELIISNKKELVIKENKLFETIKSFNNLKWYARRDSNPQPMASKTTTLSSWATGA